MSAARKDNAEVLAEAKEVLAESAGLLEALEGAPALIRNNENVKRAKDLTHTARGLVIELVHRVNDEIRGGAHDVQGSGESPEAGAAAQETEGSAD